MICTEGEVKTLGYILVIFVVIYIHFLILRFYFFGLVYTFDSMISNDLYFFTLH